MAGQKTSRKMSDEHKRALAEGRAQGKAVRAYLAALESEKRSAGRKPSKTPDQLQAEAESESDPAKRLELIQRRLDVEERLAADAQSPDLAALEAEFIRVAKPYAERKGISYTAFRELGVPAAVLKAAGISRARRANA